MSRSARFIPVEVRRFIAGDPARPADPAPPDGYGIYGWAWAPVGLLTRRQLAALGLRPGGQEPAGEIRWRERSDRGPRVAYLYRVEAAKPKRPATPAQLAALDRAMAARRTCRTCGTEAPYCLPISTGRQCLDCCDPWAVDPAPHAQAA